MLDEGVGDSLDISVGVFLARQKIAPHRRGLA
jgi:hypothetical protein